MSSTNRKAFFEQPNFDKKRPERDSAWEAELLEAAFSYYWEHGYPYVQMDDPAISKAFDQVKRSSSCFERSTDEDGNPVAVLKQSMVGLSLANLYQQKLMLTTRCRNYLTPLEVMQDEKLLREALRKRIRYGSDLHEYGIRKTVCSLRGTQRVSNFRPTVAKTIYNIFKPRLALDFSAGWGGRLLGALAAGVRYIGIDPHREAVENNQRLQGKLREFHPRLKEGTLIVDRAEAVLGYGRWRPDLIFTSPPYFDVEKYDEGHEDQSYVQYPDLEEWYREFLWRCIEGSYHDLTDDGILILNVNGDMAERTVELALEAGFRLLDEWRYALSQHQFNKSKGLFRYEPVLIFGKGGAKIPYPEEENYILDLFGSD